MEQKHGFYVDRGIWCCTTCASANAWSKGKGQPFVFWHEQSEDSAHENPKNAMPLHYGIASKETPYEEVREIAQKIIETLTASELPCTWDEDLEKCIFVSLDAHSHTIADEGTTDETDCLQLALFMPLNKDTEDWCENESFEEHGEPAGTYHFYQEIEDGESMKDALLRVDKQVRKHITHYQRFSFIDGCLEAVEPVFTIDDSYGHAGSGESMADAMNS